MDSAQVANLLLDKGSYLSHALHQFRPKDTHEHTLLSATFSLNASDENGIKTESSIADNGELYYFQSPMYLTPHEVRLDGSSFRRVDFHCCDLIHGEQIFRFTLIPREEEDELDIQVKEVTFGIHHANATKLIGILKDDCYSAIQRIVNAQADDDTRLSFFDSNDHVFEMLSIDANHSLFEAESFTVLKVKNLNAWHEKSYYLQHPKYGVVRVNKKGLMQVSFTVLSMFAMIETSEEQALVTLKSDKQ